MTREEMLGVKIMEECAEVAHRVAKALRFGFNHIQDGHTQDNFDRIRGEFLDLLAALDLLDPQLVTVNGDELHLRKARIERYMGVSSQLGTLQAPADFNRTKQGVL